jgi:hypothetical protein
MSRIDWLFSAGFVILAHCIIKDQRTSWIVWSLGMAFLFSMDAVVKAIKER